MAGGITEVVPDEQAAADQRRDDRPEGEQRHHQHRRKQARKDQRLDRRHADRAHGVDFLGDFHRAKLGGEGRARAAGDHDRGHQHAELPHRDSADQVDRVNLGPELGELDRALLGNDDADQEAHQPDDAECPHPDDVEPRDHRVDAEALWPADDVGETDQRGAEEAEQAEQGLAGLRHPLAELDQDADRARPLLRVDPRRLVVILDFLEQADFVATCPNHLGMAVADGAVDDPRSDRVHPLDFAKVDGQRVRQRVDLALRRRRAGDIERARDAVHRALARFMVVMPRFRHSTDVCAK